MSYAKGILVLATLFLTASHYVESASDLRKTCQRLRDEIDNKGLIGDTKRIIDFTHDYLSKPVLADERKLNEALKVVLKDQECSPSSIEYLLLIAVCEPAGGLQFLEEPSKAYAQKCLTSENLSQKLKSDISFEFVSPTFIKKYYELNPKKPPVNLELRSECCQSLDSVSTIANAIKQDYREKGKSMMELTSFEADEAHPLRRYLEDNLFRPCRLYINSNAKIMYYLRQAAPLYFGGNENLIATLDQEAKDAIFRFQYCADMYYGMDFVMMVAQNL